MIDRAIGLFGLAIALIVGLYTFAPAGWPKMPPWATLLGIAIGLVLLGVGAGLVIADLRAPIIPGRPELHLTLRGADIFAPDQMPNVTGIGLAARVWNTGAPSIVTSWSLKITPNGKPAVTAQLTKMPNELIASGPVNSAILRAENSLEKKTATAPVGIAPVDGVLLFYVPLPKAIVQDRGTLWELSAKDIYEKETSAAQLLGDWLYR